MVCIDVTRGSSLGRALQLPRWLLSEASAHKWSAKLPNAGNDKLGASAVACLACRSALRSCVDELSLECPNLGPTLTNCQTQPPPPNSPSI